MHLYYLVYLIIFVLGIIMDCNGNNTQAHKAKMQKSKLLQQRGQEIRQENLK